MAFRQQGKLQEEMMKQQKSDFTVAQTEFGLTITEINNKKIEVLNVPEGVTYIGRPDVIAYLFEGCNHLKEIFLPTTLRRIEPYAFNGIKHLKSVHISEGVEFVGHRAFEDCPELEEVRLPDSVKEMEAGVFCMCNGLKRVHLPKNLTEIPNDTFKLCRSLIFSDLEIPESVTRIGSEVFAMTNIVSFETPESVTSIGNELFSNCPELRSVTIGDNVTEIGEDMFGFEIPSKLKVKIGPNVVKTNTPHKHDSTARLFATFPKYYELRDEGIYNITLGKFLENEDWEGR